MTTLTRLSKALVARRRGDLRQLHFSERGRPLVAWCPDDEVFTLCRELVLDRVYERGEVRLRPGMRTVVDAGAHVGMFSLLASQWADRVVALEASELNYRVLDLNVRRNSLTNVDARHCALWSISADLVDFSPAHHSGGGAVGDGSWGEHGATGRVRATSLDDLVSEVGPIDLLKIDIEGAEYEVFRATERLDAIAAVVGEMHVEREEDRARLGSLVSRLEDAGFVVSLVPEKELLARSRLPRLWANRRSLEGSRTIKTLAAAYCMAPVRKPIRPPGATYELPILIAHR